MGRSAPTRLFGRVSFILAIAIITAAAAQAEAQTPAELKLDPSLRRRVNVAGESKVIVDMAPGFDDAAVLAGFGQPGVDLDSFNGRAIRMSNERLLLLAGDFRVERIIEDRPAQGTNGRTTITIGSRPVIDLMGYTGAGVGVAVIDSGVNAPHEDLTGGRGRGQPGLHVVHFKDFVNSRTDAYDDWGHGTHVAGIIAGSGAVSYGRHEGVAPAVNIVALKALDGNGVGTISNIIAAIDYAVSVKETYNIRVINMSLGAGVYESYNTDPLTLAAKRAVDAGIVVVASAGNLGRAQDGQPQYGAITAPGNAPWVLTVGASSTMGTLYREDDEVANYSSRGPTMKDFQAKPDLVAPGTGVVAAIPRPSRLYDDRPQARIPGLIPDLPDMPYLSLSGTSMSAPAVAGTVALMLHANPSLTPNLAKAILQFTSQVYPTYNWLTQGAGFLNAYGAVQLAEYFYRGRLLDPYPDMTGWSRHVFWGNFRVRGGVLTPFGTAWGRVDWGNMQTSSGQNIVWGDNCPTPDCNGIVWGNNIVWGNTGDDGDNIVWGNGDDDSIVWGSGNVDSVVWGSNGEDNIVWGNDCGGQEDCQDVVWGYYGPDASGQNIVWGNAEDLDNIVWGNDTQDPDNIVWGNSDDDNIVWGNTSEDDGTVWGQSDDPDDDRPTYGDQFGSPIDQFLPTQWYPLYLRSVEILGGQLPKDAPLPPGVLDLNTVPNGLPPDEDEPDDMASPPEKMPKPPGI